MSGVERCGNSSLSFTAGPICLFVLINKRWETWETQCAMNHVTAPWLHEVDYSHGQRTVGLVQGPHLDCLFSAAVRWQEFASEIDEATWCEWLGLIDSPRRQANLTPARALCRIPP